MEQRVRIRDIADRLGLSTATISNVIHGKTSKLSDETVRRVQQELELQQYIPSMAGILLAQNDSKIIGVFINDHEKYEGHTLEDAFIASSVNHLCARIEENGMFMMVRLARRAEDVLTFASMWNMDALVVIGFCHQDYMYLRSHMRIPFAIYDGFCDNPTGIINTTIDNLDGGRQMGAHFRRLGHRRALCLADNETGVDKLRIDGFRQSFGGDVKFVRIPMHKEERYEFYGQMLPEFAIYGAVFAVSDYYAIELMHFLQDHGLSVPGDVSVAGFDDIPLCQMVRPALTTIAQDDAQRAKAAIDGLLALKNGEKTNTSITLPVHLVVRKSTDLV